MSVDTCLIVSTEVFVVVDGSRRAPARILLGILFSFRTFEDNYILGKKIGAGSFGVVNLVIHKRTGK